MSWPTSFEAFDEYQKQSRQYEKSVGTDWYYTLGLTGEAGEVAEIVKKAYRVEPYNRPVDPSALALELGDILWYIAALAEKYGYNLSTIARMNLDKLENRRALGSH